MKEVDLTLGSAVGFVDPAREKVWVAFKGQAGPDGQGKHNVAQGRSVVALDFDGVWHKKIVTRRQDAAYSKKACEDMDKAFSADAAAGGRPYRV